MLFVAFTGLKLKLFHEIVFPDVTPDLNLNPVVGVRVNLELSVVPFFNVELLQLIVPPVSDVGLIVYVIGEQLTAVPYTAVAFASLTVKLVVFIALTIVAAEL